MVNGGFPRHVTKSIDEGIDSHSTVCGIRNVVELEVIIELVSHDVVSLGPDTCVPRGGKNQRNQGGKSETHLIQCSG